MKSTQTAAVAVIVTFAFAILTLGKDLIIPMVLAIFIWYLINILADSIALLKIGEFRLPRFVCFMLAMVAQTVPVTYQQWRSVRKLIVYNNIILS